MDVLREESITDEYKIFVNELNMDIGWGSRLIECDKFTSTMDRRSYFKFSKCRESSLTSYRKKFFSWLKSKQYPKIVTYFLGFIAWDRIGCIIQIARKIRGIKYGEIIKEKEDFLTPSEVVQAILFLNKLKDLTPNQLNFNDKSLDKVDISNIKLIGDGLVIKKEKTKLSGNKRKCNGNDNELVSEPANKKQRLK